MKKISFQHEDIKHITVYEHDHYLYIESLVIKDRMRNQGIGTEIIKDIVIYANAKNKTVYGYVSSELGSDLNRLKKWYAGLGFLFTSGELNSGHKYNIKK